MKMKLPVRFQKKEKYLLAGIVVCGLLEALAIILQMYVISGIADCVFLKGQPVSAVQNDFYLLAGLMIGVVLFARAGGYLADGLAFSVKDAVASLLLDKMDRLGGVYGSGTDSGSCMMLLTDGVERLEEFFARLFPQAIKTALIPVLFFAFVFPVDWVSGVLLLITIPILIFFMMMIGRFSKYASEKQWHALNRISGYLHDAMVFLPWLKLWGKAEESALKVDKLADAFRVRTLKVMQIAFLSAFVLEFFTMIGVALVAVTLGVRLVEGMVDFRMALFVILLAPEFYVPLRTLGGKYHDSIRAMSGRPHTWLLRRSRLCSSASAPAERAWPLSLDPPRASPRLLPLPPPRVPRSLQARPSQRPRRGHPCLVPRPPGGRGRLECAMPEVTA